jgi:hypothetical protein
MSQAVAALLGALIGAVAAIGGAIFAEHYRRHRDRQGVASALAGEISGILFMAERRRHPEVFENEILPKLKAGIDVPISKFTQGRDYKDPVIERYLDKIGLLLGTLPDRIVRFYYSVQGIRLDLERLIEGEFDILGKINIIIEDLALWRETESLGQQLVHELRDIAAQTYLGSH